MYDVMPNFKKGLLVFLKRKLQAQSIYQFFLVNFNEAIVASGICLYSYFDGYYGLQKSGALIISFFTSYIALHR